MEIMLRCALPDQPGALAALAGTIAEAGGDIQGVDVVETAGGRALDDLTVMVADGALRALVDRVAALDGFELVHVGPSRGHSADAVTRLAVGIESVLNGAMTFEHALRTLAGGLLRASSAEVVLCDDAPRAGERTLVLPVDGRCLVLRRDYRFTHTERQRAEALVRSCLEASRAAALAG
jgi:hypothetical protein